MIDDSKDHAEVAAVLRMVVERVSWSLISPQDILSLEERQKELWAAEFHWDAERLHRTQEDAERKSLVGSSAAAAQLRSRVAAARTTLNHTTLPVLDSSRQPSDHLPTTPALSPRSAVRALCRNEEHHPGDSSGRRSAGNGVSMTQAQSQRSSGSVPSSPRQAPGHAGQASRRLRRPLWTKLNSGCAAYAASGWAFGNVTLKMTRPPLSDKAPKTGAGAANKKLKAAVLAVALEGALDDTGKKKKKKSKDNAKGAKYERADDYFNRRFTEMVLLQVRLDLLSLACQKNLYFPPLTFLCCVLRVTPQEETITFESMSKKDRERLKQLEEKEEEEEAREALRTGAADKEEGGDEE